LLIQNLFKRNKKLFKSTKKSAKISKKVLTTTLYSAKIHIYFRNALEQKE